MRSRLSAARDAWRQQHPALADVGRELAPVWWLGRGLGAAYVVHVVLGLAPTVAAVLLVAASLYLGHWARQDTPKPAWAGILDRLWNLAGLVLVPVAAWLVLGLSVAAYGGGSSGSSQYDPPPGLALDGSSVEGIYAYGPDGARLDNVRLFATDGRPITVGSDGVAPSPWVDRAGRQWFNVFPSVNPSTQGWTVVDPNAWHPPMAIDPLLRQVATDPDPTDATTPGAEGAPTQATPTGPAPTGSKTAPTSSAPTTTR